MSDSLKVWLTSLYRWQQPVTSQRIHLSREINKIIPVVEVWANDSNQVLRWTAHATADLGVVVDSHLKMMTHVSAVCRVAYYQLRLLRLLICLLAFDATTLLVQAFISTHLDYCN